MYAPLIQSAVPKKRYTLGSYTAVLFDQIIPSGSIEYEFIIAVFKKKATAPFLFVTSERKNWDAVTQAALKIGVDPAQITQDKSHFLCVFDTAGHHNYGDSNDWGDSERFEAAALTMLAQRLKAQPAVVWLRA